MLINPQRQGNGARKQAICSHSKAKNKILLGVLMESKSQESRKQAEELVLLSNCNCWILIYTCTKHKENCHLLRRHQLILIPKHKETSHRPLHLPPILKHKENFICPFSLILLPCWWTAVTCITDVFAKISGALLHNQAQQVLYVFAKISDVLDHKQHNTNYTVLF